MLGNLLSTKVQSAYKHLWHAQACLNDIKIVIRRGCLWLTEFKLVNLLGQFSFLDIIENYYIYIYIHIVIGISRGVELSSI